MRIITVNLPVSYIKAIATLTGQEGLYPSRSELIRVAVRDFLIREIEASKSFANYHQNQIKGTMPSSDLNNDLIVRVPVESTVDGITEYKTYKIVKR